MSDLQDAIKQVCEEKNISLESVMDTIEAALAAAYRKDFGQKNQNIKVNFDSETQSMEVFDVKTVVEDMDLEELEKQREEFEAKKEAGEEVDEAELKRFNPKTESMLTEAKELDSKAEIGQEIKTKLEVPSEFGRMAAQTAKQVIIQRLREAERETIYNEFKEKEGQVVTAVVQRKEGRAVYLDIGHTLAIIPFEEQVPGENYTSGQRLKVMIVSVNLTPKGPEIIVSRSHPDLLRELFRTEVPEINTEVVEIKAIAREAGARSKVAVASNQESIDPVGSCVGQRGARVQTIISELGGEKIDIIEWNDDPEKFIINALSPAKVISLELNEKKKSAIVKVKEDQLSLAIGKAGQNVRLAARLTDWKIDIVGAEKIPEQIEEQNEEGEEESKTEDRRSKTEDQEEKKQKVKSKEQESEEKEEAKTAVSAGRQEDPESKKQESEEKVEEKSDKEEEKEEAKTAVSAGRQEDQRPKTEDQETEEKTDEESIKPSEEADGAEKKTNKTKSLKARVEKKEKSKKSKDKEDKEETKTKDLRSKTGLSSDLSSETKVEGEVRRTKEEDQENKKIIN